MMNLKQTILFPVAYNTLKKCSVVVISCTADRNQ